MKPILREPNLAAAFQTGWELYKANFGFLLSATLVVGLVSVASCGVCGAA